MSYSNQYRQTTKFSKVYGSSASSSYAAKLTFVSTFTSATKITVNSVSYTIAASSNTLTIPKLTLAAGNTNTITVTSSIAPSSLTVTQPPSTFYASTSFTPSGDATLATCQSGACTPVGSKMSWLGTTGTAALSIAAPSSSIAGSKYTLVYFCNNDIAISTSWGYGTNTRNMTISVNGVVTKIELPLSGRSSELFSTGLGWQDTGTFGVVTSGWTTGTNTVTVGNVGGEGDIVQYAADFVGVDVKW